MTIRGKKISSQSLPPPLFPAKKFIDISKIHGDDVTEIALGSIEPGTHPTIAYGSCYEAGILRMKKSCTAGGPMFSGIELTYQHDGVYISFSNEQDQTNLYQLCHLKGEYFNVRVDTSLLIEKATVYVVAMKPYNAEWMTFKNYFDVQIRNGDVVLKKEADFPFRHGESALGNLVGRKVILEALYTFVHESGSGRGGRRHEAMQSVIYHIAEAIRFTDIRRLVNIGMDDGDFVQDIGYLRVYLNDWVKLSNLLVREKYPTDADKHMFKREIIEEASDEDRVQLEKFRALVKRAKSLIFCAHFEDQKSKNLRMETAKKSREKMMKQGKEITIDSINISQADLATLGLDGKARLDEHRRSLIRRWKRRDPGKDEDVWDNLGKDLSSTTEHARYVLRNANLTPLQVDLSKTLSEAGVCYEIPLKELREFHMGI